jgi:hypothetical protein
VAGGWPARPIDGTVDAAGAAAAREKLDATGSAEGVVEAALLSEPREELVETRTRAGLPM